MDGCLLACIEPWLVYSLLAVVVAGIVGGVLLLRWFWIATGLRERQFRSSLRTLLLFVLSIASALSLCKAIDGFWLPELFLCAFAISAFVWSLFRDRELLSAVPRPSTAGLLKYGPGRIQHPAEAEDAQNAPDERHQPEQMDPWR
jgi:hypothetical protein